MLANRNQGESLASFRVTIGGREIPLAEGTTRIGRAPECQIVIEDALVSRLHATISCDAHEAIFEDLGSRNGSRINGLKVTGRRVLCHGDRLQIGSRELVFSQEAAQSEIRLQCAARSLPDAADGRASSIPPETRRMPEESITLVAYERQADAFDVARWPLEMLIELMGKAMLTGRHGDVEGILEQAVANVNHLLATGKQLERSELEALRDAASWLSRTRKTDKWLRWVQRTYVQAGFEPLELKATSGAWPRAKPQT